MHLNFPFHYLLNITLQKSIILMRMGVFYRSIPPTPPNLRFLGEYTTKSNYRHFVLSPPLSELIHLLLPCFHYSCCRYSPILFFALITALELEK